MLSLPHALRFLLATKPAALTQVLGVVYRTIARHLISQNKLQRLVEQIGAQVRQVLERRGLIERDIENA